MVALLVCCRLKRKQASGTCPNAEAILDNNHLEYLQSRPRLGTHLIEVFDAVALAAFTVVGVVVVLDTRSSHCGCGVQLRPSSPLRSAV
jgi:hypothetical protein